MPYTIDGRPVQIADEPRNLNGPIYVPLRGVGEAIGGKVGFDQASDRATASFRGSTARVFPNNALVELEGGQPKQLSVPPFQTAGQMWVPVEFFEVFGITAIADPATNTVTVNV